MTSALRKPMAIGQFLDWEAAQPTRYEFDGLQPVAMTGAHSAIQGNLAVSVRGSPCQFHGSDLKIEVAGKIRYPDGFVVGTPVTGASTVVRDPVVIFEVLSERTATTDYGAKNQEYAATPSVKRYVILSQSRVSGTMFERIGEDWIGRLLSAQSILHMPEIGIEVPLAEFYVDVDLSPPPDDKTAER